MEKECQKPVLETLTAKVRTGGLLYIYEDSWKEEDSRKESELSTKDDRDSISKLQSLQSQFTRLPRPDKIR